MNTHEANVTFFVLQTLHSPVLLLIPTQLPGTLL